MKPEPCHQQCIRADCGATFGVQEVLVACPKCGDLLDAVYDWSKIPVPRRLSDFAKRWAKRDRVLNFSGVWRFRELLDFCGDGLKVTIGEGQTLLECNEGVARYVGITGGELLLQYEGLNPSGSFKDNGMAAAFSHARMVGAKTSRLRLDGQHLGVAGAVRRAQPAWRRSCSSAPAASPSASSPRRWTTAPRPSRSPATSTPACAASRRRPPGWACTW